MTANAYQTAHSIFNQYWPTVSRDLTDPIDPEKAAEYVIALADTDNSRVFNTADLSKEDFDIIWNIVHGRAVDLTKPIIGWTFVSADLDHCRDMDAEDIRDTILSQGWECWRTSAAACKAAEEWQREQWEEFMSEGEGTMPEPDWQENGINGGLIWSVGDRTFEVHPIRMQD